MNEAETCRQLVRPRLEAAGWDGNGQSHYTEQDAITDGRIVTPSGKATRMARKVSDFQLRFRRDLTLAVVEAKSEARPAGDGLQQARRYADMLKVPFAYATNGRQIIEFDGFTKLEREVERFPTPDELWERYQVGQSLGAEAARALLIPYHIRGGDKPRYYQKIAITRAIEAILAGRQRCLLTMATGTGKTLTAFQICWKLWNACWNAKDEPGRKPRILFLADRNVLVDVPMRAFEAFGDARHKIAGEANKSREIYFALYQALSGTEGRPGLYRQYPPDFFDLILIDECHRGSADRESSWREILTYFAPAYQLGMTATPLRDDNRDSYEYFGNPLYTYSLKDGIEDGFLAPYRVHRVSTRFDSVGYRPVRGQLDRDGRAIPDRLYRTSDFERVLSLEGRNEAIAKHLTAHLRATDPYAKTIVFCVDQEHADQMRRHLNNARPDLVKEAAEKNSAYAARVTNDEGDIGRGFLDQFVQVDERFPVILTSSQMLTTGVDAPTCRNVVLVRTIGTMNEFKQIIGRGTRVREDKGKLFFTILDYAGSATEKFADPEFDDVPLEITAAEIDADGNLIRPPEEPTGGGGGGGGGHREPKYHIHGGAVSVDTEVSFDLDAAGGKLRTMQVTQYTADAVRTLYADPEKLRSRWVHECGEVERELVDRGIDSGNLAAQVGLPDADLFDILCHLAYSSPTPTRRERAERLRKGQTDFFNQFAPEPRRILQEMLEQYAAHGHRQLVMPDALEVGPVRAHGNLAEIIAKFGGADRLRDAIDRLQELLYSQ